MFMSCHLTAGQICDKELLTNLSKMWRIVNTWKRWKKIKIIEQIKFGEYLPPFRSESSIVPSASYKVKIKICKTMMLKYLLFIWM